MRGAVGHWGGSGFFRCGVGGVEALIWKVATWLSLAERQATPAVPASPASSPPREIAAHPCMPASSENRQQFFRLGVRGQRQIQKLTCVGTRLGRLVAGKYLMVKDPNKPQLRIYAVPAEEAIDTQVGQDVLRAMPHIALMAAPAAARILCSQGRPRASLLLALEHRSLLVLGRAAVPTVATQSLGVKLGPFCFTLQYTEAADGEEEEGGAGGGKGADEE